MTATTIDQNGIRYRFYQALMLIPNMLKLIGRLCMDLRVPMAEKAMLLATATYIISPLDFLPDFVPFLGQIDDLLLMALIFRRLLNAAGERLVMNYWDGDPEVLQTMNWIIDWAEHLLPAGVYARIVRKAGDDFSDTEYRVVD